MKKEKFYSLKKIKEKNCQYNMIIGERSNGKTYSVLKEIIENYAVNGKQGAIIRRWLDDFRGKRGAVMFDAHVENGLISDLTKGEYNKVVYKSSRWYFARFDEGLNVDIVDEKPFCFAFALNSMEHDKSTSYPGVTIICFDEFLTRQYYLPDEFVLFMNVISTIVRYRDDVVIYMLGNTVNKVSPYFSEMGISHIKDMKQGTIDVYTYGESQLKVAVEYCASISQSKESSIYFAFDNPKLQMITSGVWEIDIYPHCPVKYVPKDVRFIYFIIFNDEILQCEIVKKDNLIFTFIHRKTTELKDEENDLIYNLEYNPGRNYRRKITKPTNKREQLILDMFNQGKVFYQDNEVGEIVRNYFVTCQKG